MTENEFNGFNSNTTARTEQELRAEVTACTSCLKVGGHHDVKWAPRFGLGKFDKPKLMVLQRQPNRDPETCWHSAFGIHYMGHEQYEALMDWKMHAVQRVLELVELTKSDVWATSAVKCPGQFNKPITYPCMGHCSRIHLRHEVFSVKPKVILSIGWPPEFLFRYPAISDPDYRVTYTDPETMCSMVSYSNIVKVHTLDESMAWVQGVVREIKKVYLRCYGREW